MNSNDPNFKSGILKIFFTYLVVYLLALIFKYTYDLEAALINIQYKYLIALNMISIFLGLPLSIIFDFILIKLFGIYYVLFFFPVLTFLSVTQVLILRKIKFKFFRNILFLKKTAKNSMVKFFKKKNFKSSRSIYFYKKLENNYVLKLFENFTFISSHILIIRSFPILPHVLGSYIIASSKIKKKVILINTFLGSLLYYIFLFLVIVNV